MKTTKVDLVKLKKENPQFQLDIIQQFSDNDPSGENIYVPFMIEKSKEFVNGYFANGTFAKEGFVNLFAIINKFNTMAKIGVLENPDIYSYPDIASIESAITKAKKILELYEQEENSTKTNPA